MKLSHALVFTLACLTACLDSGPSRGPATLDDTVARHGLDDALTSAQLAPIDARGLSGRIAVGNRVELTLPGSGRTELVIRSVTSMVPGITTFSGHLASDESADFTFSMEAGRLLGAIRQGTDAWLVEPHPSSDQHVIRVIDRTKLQQHEPSEHPQSLQRDTTVPHSDTPGVLQVANGTGNVRVLFLHATDVTDPGMRASNIVQEFNDSLFFSLVSSNNTLTLAGVQQVASTFAGLTRLQIRQLMIDRAAPFTGIDAAMDSAGADIAFLLVNEDATVVGDVGSFGRVGGIARIFEQNNPFALSTQTYALGDRTALHEIGHVLGGRHENDGTSIARPVVAADDTWMTIMGGYIECPFVGLPATCVRLGRWSNPDQTWNGIPLGIHGQRDMESHLEGSMPTVSAWCRTPANVDCGDGSQLAAITSPPPGSTLPGASATFTWTTGTGVSQYYLYAGSSLGGSNYYQASQGTATSGTVTNLPTNGSTVYIRLWSYTSTGWQFNDYSYTAAQSIVAAAITSPAPGSTLPGASATFTWNTGSGISQYYLYAGSAVGASNYYAASQGTATSGTVTNLPTNGSTVHIRLWSYSSVQGWLFRDYSYLAASTPQAAFITSPAPGSTLGTSATFTWNPGVGATQYYLYVGNSTGSAEIYAASQGQQTSGTVSNLPTDGRLLYVRLWSLIAGSWQFRDYTYRATTQCSPLAGQHGQMWMPVSALSQYVYRDGWCSVGHGLPEQCWEGTYFYYQNLQSSSCSQGGSTGSCYDNDAWWYVTCDSLVDCIYDCSGTCIKADC